MTEANHYRNLAAAWRKGLTLSSTSYRNAIAKEYERYADELALEAASKPSFTVTVPAPLTAPAVLPNPSLTISAAPPPLTAWPRMAGPGPTGPKKPLTPSGPITTTAHNQIIDGVDVAGIITVAHNGVTIRNFAAYGISVSSSTTQTTIEDGRIIPPVGATALEAGVVYSNYTIRRCEIAHTFDGLKAHGNVYVEDCWIHDIDARTGTGNTAGGPHTDGIQIGSGSNIHVVRTKFERISANGGVFASTDFGPVSNLVVEDCSFTQAGNFALFIVPSGANPTKPYPSNVIIRRNQIGPSRLPDMGYAWIAATAVTWDNNVDETGKPIPYAGSSTPNRRVVLGV